jgi:transketolase
MVTLFLIQYLSRKHKKFHKNSKHNCWAHTEFNQCMEIECITGLLWQGVENDVVMAVS